jgi:hypothetical protein
LSRSEKLIRVGRAFEGFEKFEPEPKTPADTGCTAWITGSTHADGSGQMIAVCGGQSETGGGQAAR